MQSDLFPEAELVDAFGRVTTPVMPGRSPAQPPAGEGFSGGGITGTSTFGPELGEAFPTAERVESATPAAAASVTPAAPIAPETTSEEAIQPEIVEAEPVNLEPAELAPEELEAANEGQPDTLAPLVSFEQAEWKPEEPQGREDLSTAHDAHATRAVEPTIIETGPLPVETEPVPLDADLEPVAAEPDQPVLDVPPGEPVAEAPLVTFAAVEPAVSEAEVAPHGAEPSASVAPAVDAQPPPTIEAQPAADAPAAGVIEPYIDLDALFDETIDAATEAEATAAAGGADLSATDLSSSNEPAAEPVQSTFAAETAPEATSVESPAAATSLAPSEMDAPADAVSTVPMEVFEPRPVEWTPTSDEQVATLFPAGEETAANTLESDAGEPSPLLSEPAAASEQADESALAPEDADLWALEALEDGAPAGPAPMTTAEPAPLADVPPGDHRQDESALPPPETVQEEAMATPEPPPVFDEAQQPATAATPAQEPPATVVGEVPAHHGGPATSFEEMFPVPAAAEQPAVTDDFFDELEPSASVEEPTEPTATTPAAPPAVEEITAASTISEAPPQEPTASLVAPAAGAVSAAATISDVAAMAAKPPKGLAPPRPRLSPTSTAASDAGAHSFGHVQPGEMTPATSADAFGAGASHPAGAATDVFGAAAPAALSPARALPAARKPAAAAPPAANPPGAARKPLGSAAATTSAFAAAPAPLARKLNTPAAPRKAIVARPGLMTGAGFRPPTVPPRGAAGIPPTTRSMTQLANVTPPATVVGSVPPIDPFTNSGDPARPAAGPKSRRKLRVVLIVLAVVLVAAAIAFIFWKFRPTGTVRGSLRFQNLWKNEVVEGDRKLFQEKQRATLLSPNVVQAARLDLGDKGVPAGFLENELAVNRMLDSATWDPATESLVLTHPEADAEDPAERERMARLLSAMRQAYLTRRLSAAGTSATINEEKDQRELRQIEDEIDKLDLHRDDLKETANSATAKRTEADRLNLEVEKVRRQLTETATKVRSLDREVGKMEAAVAARPGTRPATQPGDPAGGEIDPELAQMETQLKLLNESLTAAIEAKETAASRAKALLDAAQKRFDEQVAAARDVAAGHALLSDYLEKIAPVQLELRRLDDELAQQQKDERSDLEALRKTLSEQAAARIQRAWNADADLEQLVKRRAVAERKHSAAVSLGLPDAEALRTELANLDRQIESRRTTIAAADERDPVNQKLAEFFEASLKRNEQSRKRNEARLAALVTTLTKAKPAIDKLPAEQQAQAKRVDEALAALTTARDVYTTATAQANANTDTLVRQLTGQVSAQQARVEARRKELAEARAGDPAAAPGLKAKQEELARMQEAEANVQKLFEETKDAHRQAESDAVTALAAQRTIPELDRQLTVLREKKTNLLRQLAARNATPESIVTVPEVTAASVTLSPAADKRGYFVGFAGIGGLVLVLMALAATRTPHETYIPPMVHEPPVYEALPPAAEDETFAGLIDPDEAFHASGDVFALPAPSQQQVIPKRVLPV